MLYDDDQWTEDEDLEDEEESWIDQVRYEVSGYIDDEIAAGFLDPDEIAARAIEGLRHGPHSFSVVSFVENVTYEAWESHLQWQRSWPEVTDCDRLDRAFAELEQAGIFARQHYKCCRTCAGSALWEEMKTGSAQGRMVRGYLYYHSQGTERAILGQGLGLYFGSIEQTPEATVVIGQEVVDALQRHGLTLTWDGTADRCIDVEMEWMRRRSTPQSG